MSLHTFTRCAAVHQLVVDGTLEFVGYMGRSTQCVWESPSRDNPHRFVLCLTIGRTS